MLMIRMKQMKKPAMHLKHLVFFLAFFCFFLLPISSCVSKDNLVVLKLTEEPKVPIPSEYGGGSLPMVILSYSRSCGADGRWGDMAGGETMFVVRTAGSQGWNY